MSRRGTRSTTRYDPAIGTGPNERESAIVTVRLSDSTDIVPSPCTSDTRLTSQKSGLPGCSRQRSCPTRADPDGTAIKP